MNSRGLRNRNPGNIRRSKLRYKGEVAGNDPLFKTFRSAKWGYRAIFVVLHTYRVRHGIRTLREMIARWAPPTENRTENYIRFVSRATGIGPEAEPDTLDAAQMQPLVAALSRMENGTDARTDDLQQGWLLFRHDFG